MITHLRGTLTHKQPAHITLDVQGIGYELEIPLSTYYQLPELKNEILLLTHLSIREDAHTLYGFLTEEERRLFRHLIKVTGIGAKTALNILSTIEFNTFIQAIQTGDINQLIRVPGIGKKTAERLLIEIRDKLENLCAQIPTTSTINTNPTTPTTLNSGVTSPIQDAISALIALGYKPQEATQWIQNIADPTMTSEQLIRLALKRGI